VTEKLRIEVEPLSERRWAEIEQRTLDRSALEGARPEPPARASRAPWLAAAAAALVALGLGALRGPGERIVTASTSRIVTESGTTRTMAGDVDVEIGPGANVLLLERAPDAWLVSIEQGSCHFSVPSRQGRPPFVIEAGRTRVEVVGTRFTVSRALGADVAAVVVEEGTVRVTEGGEPHLVHAGERWRAERELTAVHPATTIPETSAPEAAGVATPVGSGDVEEAVAVTRPAGTARRAVPAPTEPSVIAEPAPEASSEPPPSVAAVDEITPVAPEASEGVLSAPSPTSEPPPAPSVRERFARAEAMESRDPATALSEYEALAREGGPWGANALYAQARLLLERGQRDRARALLQRYLELHPSGMNAEDARALLDRTR
jgi:hypothetical protein